MIQCKILNYFIILSEIAFNNTTKQYSMGFTITKKGEFINLFLKMEMSRVND